jgi:hypothetical protein
MSTGVRQSSHDEFTSMSFGFGYEPQSPDRPSIQAARAEFLNTIAAIKPEVGFRLFGTCYLPFTELLEQSNNVIAATSSEIDANILKENSTIKNWSLRCLVLFVNRLLFLGVKLRTNLSG